VAPKFRNIIVARIDVHLLGYKNKVIQLLYVKEISRVAWIVAHELPRGDITACGEWFLGLYLVYWIMMPYHLPS